MMPIDPRVEAAIRQMLPLDVLRELEIRRHEREMEEIRRREAVLRVPHSRHGSPRLDLSDLDLSKEQAACCLAKRDSSGRLPIGFCGRDCQRRERARLIRRYRRSLISSAPPLLPEWREPSEWDDPTGDAASA